MGKEDIFKTKKIIKELSQNMDGWTFPIPSYTMAIYLDSASINSIMKMLRKFK